MLFKSNNLYKRSWVSVKEEETRIIDSNGLVEKRMEDAAAKMPAPLETEAEEGDMPEGFAAGLDATALAGLVGEDGELPAVIKAQPAEPVYEGPSPEELIAEANEEIAAMKKQAEAEIESERARALEKARKEGKSAGYEEGKEKAQAELASEKQRLEKEYEEMVQELEPEFIRHICGIYEHILHVDLNNYRDIVLYLLSECIQKSESGRNFIVHVSKDDYPYVSMQKKQLMDEISLPGATVEIIEDITLKKSECMVETEGGIFDCSLDVQLAALQKELMLLAYEKEQ